MRKRQNEYIHQGLSPEDARWAALRSFGGVTQTKEVCRQVRSFMWLDDLQQDVRYALRLLWRSPGFAAAAALTLTLGIGMTTAVFTVINAVLLRPIPFPEPERLLMIWETDRDSGTTSEPGSLPDFLDFEQRSRRVDRFAAFVTSEKNLTPDHADPVRPAVLEVTSEFLPLLGVRPVVGRSITTADRDRGAAMPY